MSLSGKNEFLAEAACPAHRKAGQSGRTPDPVTGSASRQGRLTASPGGALSGRDRSLQCEKVSKAFPCSARARRRWWGWWRADRPLAMPIGFRPFWPEPVFSGRPSRGGFLLVPAAVAQRRLPCFQGRSPDTDGDPEAPPMIIGVRTNGTKAEPPTIVVSWVTREAGGSRVACGKQAAGTSDFKGR
jgi:hypothetical protein